MTAQDVLEIKGKVSTALCYAKVVEEEAVEQIRRMCDYEFTQGALQFQIMLEIKLELQISSLFSLSF